MANALYDNGREAFLGKEIDWVNDDTRLILSDAADYVKNLATDEVLTAVPAGARVATSGAMASKTRAAGVADAADITFPGVAGDEAEELICYQHTGVEGSSLLIFNIDTAAGLPITPGGGDIQVQWDNGANRVFKL